MPNDPEIREDEIKTLLNDFESGKISRRDLFKGATALGVFAIAGDAAGQSTPIAGRGRRIRNAGRKVLLERLINHIYKPVDKTQVAFTQLGGAAGSAIRVISPGHGLSTRDYVKINGVRNRYPNVNGKIYEISTDNVDYFDLIDPATNAKGGTINTPNGKWTLWQNQVDRLYGAEGGIADAKKVSNVDSTIQIKSAFHGLATDDRIVVKNVRGLVGANNTDPMTPNNWPVDIVDAQTFKLRGSTASGNLHIPNTGTWEDNTNPQIFTKSPDHQDWLFSEGNYSTTGLKSYDHATNKSALIDNINGHTGKNIGGAGNELTRMNREARGANLALYQRGHVVPGNDYNFEDVYGLMRMKLAWVCKHCTTETLAHTFYWMLGTINCDPSDYGKRFTDFSNQTDPDDFDFVPVVPVGGGDPVNVYVREFIQAMFPMPEPGTPQDPDDTLLDEYKAALGDVPDQEHKEVDWSIIEAGLSESVDNPGARSKHGDY
jgi:hypothetical protein